MRAIRRYALQPKPDTGEERNSTLLRDGIAIASIPGVVLEAQYGCNVGDILFVTHDIPFEEQLEILLFDGCGHLLDRVSLYGINTTGAYEPGAVIDDRTIHFRFFEGSPWQVHILQKPHWRLPLSDPHGVHRHTRFCKQLDISRMG